MLDWEGSSCELCHGTIKASPGGCKTSQENLTEDSCYPSQDSNQAPPKCDSRNIITVWANLLFRLMTMQCIWDVNLQTILQCDHHRVSCKTFSSPYRKSWMHVTQWHVGTSQMFTLYCCTVSHRSYWVFGICPPSGILKTIQHNVFLNWICFRPQMMGETHTLLGPLERANLNHWILRTETDPVSEMLCSLAFRILDDGQSPKPQ
jgi:hypothetical protein